VRIAQHLFGLKTLQHVTAYKGAEDVATKDSLHMDDGIRINTRCRVEDEAAQVRPPESVHKMSTKLANVTAASLTTDAASRSGNVHIGLSRGLSEYVLDNGP
jgi:hypothetical protein